MRTISLRLPDDLLIQLDSEAKARRVTKSWLVRESVEKALRQAMASGLRHHAWAVEQWKRLRPPLLTCEPVPTEAAFLLKREGREADALFALLEWGAIRIAFAVEEEQADLRALMRRYRE